MTFKITGTSATGKRVEIFIDANSHKAAMQSASKVEYHTSDRTDAVTWNDAKALTTESLKAWFN